MKFTLLAAIALTLPVAAHAQAPGEDSALRTIACDYACLTGTMQQFMNALAAGDASALPVSGDVLYTENNVPLSLGQGSWRTTLEVDDNGLLVADETTGHAAWFGSIRENDFASFYAVRIHVSDGLIDEAEAVIHRKSGLPAPYGDWQGMEHFAEFAEILPEDERRPRERMLAIADAYFDTVELNDGQVFAPFSEDCARLENGILTTAPIAGQQQSAAAIASGCRAQFELGIYRINKRIRRRLPLVDVQRGVVVGAGFFDHANEFDRYLLTNGSEMKTALKWPNSITLLEAFRIRDGAIQRIEATFTYVPYFMHNPFWGAEADFPEYAARPGECDTACLTKNADALVSAMVGNRWQSLNWSDKQVGYAENSVGIRIGESVWRTINAVDTAPLIVADEQTGKAVWIGRIEEHGQPAWAAITMLSDGEAIGGADVLVRRKEYGAPYTEPVSAPQFAPLPASERTSRADMAAGMHAFFAALEENGRAPDLFADDCRWLVNGQDVGACPAPFGSPALAGIERVRDIELLAMDEVHGLAIYRQYEDKPAADDSGYPLTYQVVELAHFERGRITRIEAFTSELPYAMGPIQRR